mgnify:CR=1 FL=1
MKKIKCKVSVDNFCSMVVDEMFHPTIRIRVEDKSILCVSVNEYLKSEEYAKLFTKDIMKIFSPEKKFEVEGE